jgi:eukaryotic-like serine/threonine-protein kinase
VSTTVISRSCPRCGRLIPAGAPRGFCPHCVLGGVLRRETAVATEDEPATERLRTFGDYLILGEIARGGQGVVYRARQRSLNRMVAVKVLRDATFADPEGAARFRGEAEAAASLKHANIVGIHEIGEHEGQAYFSMELVSGRSLAQLSRDEAVSPEAAARYVRTSAEAVQHAHSRGILHRDLKPSNILLDEFDQPKITDFGLAKRMEFDSQLTLSGQVLGSPNYLPPEQATSRRGPVGPYSDVYGLGAILYQLLTGRPPFQGDTIPEVLQQVLDAEPLAPRQLRPAVPRDLETICLKCLRKEPARRYASAQELADELGRFLAGEPILARPVTAAERIWLWCRRRPRVAALVGGALLLLLILAVGGPLAAIRIDRARTAEMRERVRAESAEKESRDQLRSALLAQARALHQRGRMGQRFEALDVIAQATQIRPGLDARNEAIAALALPDLRRSTSWVARSFSFEKIMSHAGAGGYLEGPDDPGNLRWREIGTGRVRHVLAGEPDEASAGGAVISRTARFAAARFKNDVLRVWDLESGALLFRLTNRPYPGPPGTFTFGDDFRFSPDERFLVAGRTNGGLDWFQLPDGRHAGAWDDSLRPQALAFSPDGRTLLAGQSFPRTNGALAWIDVATRRERFRVTGPDLPKALGWSGDGQWVAQGADNLVHLRRASDGDILRTFRGFQGNVWDVAFTDGDRLLAMNLGYGKLKFADGLTTQTRIDAYLPVSQMMRFGAEASSWVQPVDDTNAVSISLVPSPVVRELPGPGATPSVVAWASGYVGFSPDGRWLVTCGLGEVVLRDGTSGAVVQRMDFGGSRDQTTATFTTDGRHLLVVGEGSGVHRMALELDARGGVRLGAPQSVHENPGFILIGASGDRRSLVLYSYARRQLRLLELGDPKHDRLLAENAVNDASLRPDGTSLAIFWSPSGEDSAGTRATLADAQTGRVVREFDAPTGELAALAWSADGTRLCTTDGNMVIAVWDADTGTKRVTFEPIQGAGVDALGYSGDGRYAALGNSEATQLYDAETGRRLAVLPHPGDAAAIRHVRFSPDGRRLAALRTDGSLQLWDLEALKQHLGAMGLAW